VPHPYGQDERSGGVIEPALDASASAPFDALLHAIQTHDRAALTAALSPHARLSVPPLRIHVEGAQDVATTIADVAYAFDYLRYTMRSRYLAPGQVTDEAELSGVHARDLLGAPPTGRASTVVMRVGPIPDPTAAPPAVGFEDVTKGYVPWSTSSSVP